MKEQVKNLPQDSAFEYAFEKVPENKRKNLLGLTIVLAGFPIALSNFIIGGMVASQLPFLKAMLALAVGNLILMSVVILMGLLASGTGLSSTFLSRIAFGKAGSFIFSMLLFLSALTWISMNADIFSRLIHSLFSWWPVPIPLTAALVVIMWLLSAMRGYKGLAFMSNIGVPAAIILSLFGVIFIVSSDGGLAKVFNYVPEASMTFTAATAAIVGGWIYGATITADITRFAKRKTHVVIAGIIAFSIGCLGFQIAGAFVAIGTGESDFIQAMIQSGLGFIAFVTAVFCLWTTEDKEIYTGSLALQNIIKETRFFGKVKHIHTASIVAIVAALFAALGIFAYIMPIIQFLSILIPPIPGIIIAEGLIVKNSKQDQWINKTAILSWVIGGTLSYIALKTDFFISPLVGLISAGVVYIAFEKIKEMKSESNTVTNRKIS